MSMMGETTTALATKEITPAREQTEETPTKPAGAKSTPATRPSPIRILRKMLVVRSADAIDAINVSRAIDHSAGIVFDASATLQDSAPGSGVAEKMVSAAERVFAELRRLKREHACPMYVGGDIEALGERTLRALRMAGVSTITGGVTDARVKELTEAFNQALQPSPAEAAADRSGKNRRTRR